MRLKRFLVLLVTGLTSTSYIIVGDEPCKTSRDLCSISSPPNYWPNIRDPIVMLEEIHESPNDVATTDSDLKNFILDKQLAPLLEMDAYRLLNTRNIS